MAKKLLEDIKPISRSTSPKREVKQIETYARVEVPYEPSSPRESPRYGLWYIAAACIIGLLFSVSFLFEHAVVVITPKTAVEVFDSTDTFTASKDSTDPSAISYDLMTLSGDESIKLTGTIKKDLSQSATGTVVVYNTYKTTGFRLVKNAIMASTNGPLYHTTSAVIIPGYTMVVKPGSTKKVLVPGSIEVNVEANVAGEAGNTDLTDFTFPGLAAYPQGKKIYGRSKTPITGGVSGTVYMIPQDSANQALGTLSDKLRASLILKARAQVPDGYIFYDGATLFTPGSSVEAPYSKDPEVTIALHGTINAYLIKQDTLVQAIAQKLISQYSGESVSMPKVGELALSPAVGTTLSPDTDTSFSFTFSGTAKMLWAVDKNQITQLLSGKSKSQLSAILGATPNVERADVSIKPFWKSSFPDDPTRIEVGVNTPEI